MASRKQDDVIAVDAERAREAWLALMENACQLLVESLRLEGSPRSVALLTLCMEEASKGDLIWALGSHMWDKEGYSGTVILKTNDLRSHRVKLMGAAGMDAYLGPFWGDFSGEPPTKDEALATADALNARKMAAFYVDVEPGAVTRPVDLDLESFSHDAERVAGVLEMCLIREHTRAQALEGVDVDPRVDRAHGLIMPIAHPEMFEDE